MKTKKEWCSPKKAAKKAIFELYGEEGLARYNLDWDSFTIDFSDIGSDCYSYNVQAFKKLFNSQAVDSSPTISSKTCVNTAFSQVFSFSEMHFKIQYATKNLTLFYKVRFFRLSDFSPKTIY